MLNHFSNEVCNAKSTSSEGVIGQEMVGVAARKSEGVED